MPIKFTSDQLNAPFEQDPDLMIAAVVNWWGENFPEAPLEFTLEHLGVLAQAAVVRARGYGITHQPQVCAFASLMWLYGPNFDDVPKMKKILTSDSDQEAKIEALYTRIPEQLWQKASDRRDENRWIEILKAEQADV